MWRSLQYTSMECVFVIIAEASAFKIDTEIVSAVIRAIKPFTKGIQKAQLKWLTPRIACEFPCTITDRISAIKAARNIVGSTPIDVCCVPLRKRRKKLLVADMDSTIITFETFDEIVANSNPEIRTKVLELTTRAMAGEMDYATSFRKRASLLKGMPATLLNDVRNQICIANGAHQLIATMQSSGAICALVSSGLKLFTDHVAMTLGFDHSNGNQIEIINGVITGNAINPILDGTTKRNTLYELQKQYDLSKEDTMAVGDGANDIEMIATAGVGVAFHAKNIVAERADVSINHADLSALLYLQGYGLSEIKST